MRSIKVCSLDETQREQCSVEELARVIFCLLKESDKGLLGLEYMQESPLPRKQT